MDQYTVAVENDPDPITWLDILLILAAHPPLYATKPFKWLRHIPSVILGSGGTSVLAVNPLDHLTPSVFRTPSHHGSRNEIVIWDEMCVLTQDAADL